MKFIISRTHIADNQYVYLVDVDGIRFTGFEAIINPVNNIICITQYYVSLPNYDIYQQKILAAFAYKMLPSPVYIEVVAFSEKGLEQRFGLEEITSEELSQTLWRNSHSDLMTVYKVIPSAIDADDTDEIEFI